MLSESLPLDNFVRCSWPLIRSVSKTLFNFLVNPLRPMACPIHHGSKVGLAFDVSDVRYTEKSRELLDTYPVVSDAKMEVLLRMCTHIRVRNEVVRARTGVRRELAARVDMNVLRWFGHVERMDSERLLKKVMNAKVDGRSARGRPRFGRMDGVKRALNDRRMDIREASERARNRNEWRMIVTEF